MVSGILKNVLNFECLKCLEIVQKLSEFLNFFDYLSNSIKSNTTDLNKNLRVFIS